MLLDYADRPCGYSRVGWDAQWSDFNRDHSQNEKYGQGGNNTDDLICLETDDIGLWQITTENGCRTLQRNEAHKGKWRKNRKWKGKRTGSDYRKNDERSTERDGLLRENAALEADIFELDMELTFLQDRAQKIQQEVDNVFSKFRKNARLPHYVPCMIRSRIRKLRESIERSRANASRIRQNRHAPRFGRGQAEPLRDDSRLERQRCEETQDQRRRSLHYFTLSELDLTSRTRFRGSSSLEHGNKHIASNSISDEHCQNMFSNLQTGRKV